MNILDGPKSPDRIGATHDLPLRKLGIAGVEDVPWGTHICQVYTTQADLLEVLAPYFSEGLKSNEFCLWITAEPLGVAAAKAALHDAVPQLDAFVANGQIEILDHREWYTYLGRFDGSRARAAWLNKLEMALGRGFDGLRVTGDTYWLAEDEFESFIEYEAKLAPVIASNRMLAICSYSSEKFGMREIFDAIANHDFALIREHGRWDVFTSLARRRAAQSVKESEARLRATVEGVNEGILTLDETGTILFANSAALRMFGYTASEVTGKHVSALAPGATRVKWDGVPVDVMRIWKRKYSGRAREGRGRHKDGSLFPIEYTMSEIPLDGQRLMVGFVRNLTQSREIEERMQRLHADRLNAMGGMATALAHEINQPLSAVITYLSAAQRSLKMPPELRPENVEDTLAKAAVQALRAAAILKHMRQFVSRGEPDKAVHHLHDLIAEACELTNAIAKAISAQVVLNLDAKDDRVLADRIQIQQVIVNLKRNAIEAMSGSTKRQLTISTSLTEDGMIRTDIVDTGPGFMEDGKKHLFEPFMSNKAHGMGVGLTISRSIVEAHYGELWGEPNPEGGAILSFTLPLADHYESPEASLREGRA
jgi:two-component system, LuxR family, sensor kinase FixL